MQRLVFYTFCVVGMLGALFPTANFAVAQNLSLVGEEHEVWQRLYQQNLHYSLDFSQLQPYYTHSSILLELTLTNEGTMPIEVPIGESRLMNVQFLVRDPRMDALEPPQSYLNAYSQLDKISYRTVSLYPNESLSFEVNLRDFVAIKEPGFYTISSHFLLFDRDIQLSSNHLALRIQPPLFVHPSASSDEREPNVPTLNPLYGQLVEWNLYRTLQGEDFYPDQIVSLAIKARKEGKEQEYFLYFDLEELILKSPLVETYKNASGGERLVILNQFRTDLWQRSTYPAIIPDAPAFFEILHTEYGSHTAKVMADLYFTNENLLLQKQYTFYLNKLEGYWRIFDHYVESGAVSLRNEMLASLP